MYECVYVCIHTYMEGIKGIIEDSIRVCICIYMEVIKVIIEDSIKDINVRKEDTNLDLYRFKLLLLRRHKRQHIKDKENI